MFGIFKSIKKSSQLVKISNVFREDYSFDFQSMMKSSNKREEATDAIILTLINKNVKQRRDSIEQFKNGGRADLVTKEEEQLNIILQYLPQQLSADEIKVIVQQGIDEISAKTMQDMGKLMGLLKPQLEGKADMSIVSASVKELLN